MRHKGDIVVVVGNKCLVLHYNQKFAATEYTSY
jgi:hypothetical protein